MYITVCTVHTEHYTIYVMNIINIRRSDKHTYALHTDIDICEMFIMS